MIENTFRRFERGSRYYQFWVQVDLLGDLVVVVVNGAIDSAMGRIRSNPVASMCEAQKRLQALDIERKKANYDLISQ